MLLQTVCINGTQTSGTKFDLNPLKRTDNPAGKWEVQNVPGGVTSIFELDRNVLPDRVWFSSVSILSLLHYILCP